MKSWICGAASAFVLAGCASLGDRPPLDTPVSEAELAQHIAVLASDEFGGREPGTDGETKTLGYLSAALAKSGFTGGAEDGGWYQRVELLPCPSARYTVAAKGPCPPPRPGPAASATTSVPAAPAPAPAPTPSQPVITHNLIVRLPGTNPAAGAVLVLGHWDHIGICQPEGPPDPQGTPDRICNGAVDNASGIAVMLAVAKRLGRGPRLERDVYLLATTAEEKGLLGAYHFAANPPVPLDRFVVAFNIDTIAIGPRGLPVATIGEHGSSHERAIHDVARDIGRALDNDGEADDFVKRQDGWALAAKGVPAYMVGGSFSDMKLLQAFLTSDYHGINDELTEATPLGGAAEDADFHVALVRRFANPRKFPMRQAATTPVRAAR